jgi:predicted O-methyltransferase YrrM
VTDPTPSLPEVRRLCATLAAGRRAAEIGTLYGDGAEAIAATAASLVTVEPDRELAARARERLPRGVEVVCADWRTLLEREPFGFVFVDGGGPATKTDTDVVRLLAPGGIAVLDDLTPGRPGPDPVRELWLGHSELEAVEILTTPASAAILAVRR